jgi:hypothetical protein
MSKNKWGTNVDPNIHQNLVNIFLHRSDS